MKNKKNRPVDVKSVFIPGVNWRKLTPLEINDLNMKYRYQIYDNARLIPAFSSDINNELAYLVNGEFCYAKSTGITKGYVTFGMFSYATGKQVPINHNLY